MAVIALNQEPGKQQGSVCYQRGVVSSADE